MKYDKRKVAVIIPAKNEAEGLQKVIKSVKKYGKEIIVVDGHSTDNTKEICIKENITYLLDNGIGKGEAVREALKKVKTPFVVIFDADGSPNENDIPALITPLLEKKADIVIASRRLGGSYDYNISIEGILRTMGSDFLTYLVNKRFSTNFSDILYCFRAADTKKMKTLPLVANKFDFEQDVVIQALKHNLRVIETPSRERARGWGKSKLQTITGLSLLYLLVKELYFS